MLIGLKLGNWRSFCEPQAFYFPAVSTRRCDPPRVAAIFGPNASGKTNLIFGFAALRDLVLHSTAYTDQNFTDHYEPFQFGRFEGAPVEFEIDLELEQTRYRYNVAYDAQRVVFERLLVYRTDKPQRWFERHFDAQTQTEIWAPFSPSFNGTRELWRRMTRPKSLFLSTAAHLECDQLRPLFDWFGGAVEILRASDPGTPAAIAASIQDADLKARMLEVMRAVDLPVRDIRIVEVGIPGDGRSAEGPRIEFQYSRPDGRAVWLDSAIESRGALQLLALLGPLLPAIDRGRLLLIDDFGCGLHSLVSRFLMQLIKQAPKSHGKPQVLLTSRDAALMVPEVLANDEVWLMERDSDRSSRLLPVTQRGPRKHEWLGRGYLKGRFGAVPEIRIPTVPAVASTTATPRGTHADDLA